MCMFCAAIPTAVTLGVAASSQQRTAHKQAIACGEPAPRRRLPIAPLTAGVTACLLVGSIIYHTHVPF